MLKDEYLKQAKKFTDKCGIILRKRLKKKVDSLKINPYPSDCKKIILEGEDFFRVRVGDYRILYYVDEEKNVLFISKIDKRGRVYKVREDDEWGYNSK